MNDFDDDVNESNEDDSFEVELPPEKELAKPGWYPAVVVGYDKTVSKNSGNPQIVWTFKGTDIGELRDYTPLTETAVWKLNDYVVALELGQPGTKVTLGKRLCIGKRLMVRIKHEDFDGRKVLKIGGVKRHPNGAKVPEGEELPF